MITLEQLDAIRMANVNNIVAKLKAGQTLSAQDQKVLDDLEREQPKPPAKALHKPPALSSLPPVVATALVEAAATGAPLKLVAKCAGISYRKLQEVLDRGSSDMERGDNTPEAELSSRLMQAMGDAHLDNFTRIVNLRDRSEDAVALRAATWIAEHASDGDFVKTIKTESTGVTVDPEVLDAAARAVLQNTTPITPEE